MLIPSKGFSFQKVFSLVPSMPDVIYPLTGAALSSDRLADISWLPSLSVFLFSESRATVA